MNRSWFPIILVAVLLGLLGLLASLQYKWLGQISDDERERMKVRLQSDTERFAEDFNREIRNAYFSFQLDARFFHNRDWAKFNERYNVFVVKTAYSDLIKNFYFFEQDSGNILRYAKEKGVFEPSERPEILNNVERDYSAESKILPVSFEKFSLVMPVYDEGERFDRIIIRAGNPKPEIFPEVPKLKRFGILFIELDKSVVKEKILRDLTEKYFPQSDAASYKISVVTPDKQTFFQTGELSAADSTGKLFDLSPENFSFVSNREAISSVAKNADKKIVLSKIESRGATFSTNSDLKEKSIESSANMKEKVITEVFAGRLPTLPNENSSFRVLEISGNEEKNIWTLNIQHTDGSLDGFIEGARRKNLAVSFGILSLLGISVVLIFISAQRAKLLAQRQLNFVSAVSHEFRTPLAVIHSAGENLADGVTKEQAQVSRYGNLIKGEGKKLSAMVEQILEFAGARSGKRKYDFQTVEIKEIIRNAVAECQPLIDEKGFLSETEISESLSPILADKIALTQVLQNLIANSLKYSDGEKYLKITAKNGDGKVKISVEDKGIGIERKDLNKIFEPFYRAKSVVDAQIHGNGLGLSLVKQIIEAHGGKIFVESEKGKGSKFIVELKS